ncbi:beta-propeller fold lactonase family protein [Thermithiobacillus plumbiphilus]|uniref:Beta-propeller fold lactonase family protein n=1 Tax=Thermithiobacillus plumbiphilus TaxID=1729899 RepID=A0ABU9D6Z9_9PROT
MSDSGGLAVSDPKVVPAVALKSSLATGRSDPVALRQPETAEKSGAPLTAGELLPTGFSITPKAGEGARFQPLNPDLPSRPDYLAGQAVATNLSPDGKTLLILTSGYNRMNGSDGKRLPEESNEYVFVYDVSKGQPVKRQVIQVPNTFNGLVWHPSGLEFYVSGGVDDKVHVYQQSGGKWAEAGAIALGHTAGLGLAVKPMAAGLAVNKSGTALLVANFENDSVSVIDLKKRVKTAEVPLRPGKIDPAQSGQPGGEFPFWITIKGDDKAYVSSQRDRQVVVLDLTRAQPEVVSRIPVGGQPNKMLLNKAQDRLFVANGNSDTVSVIDTRSDKVLSEIRTTAPAALFANPENFNGSNPNSLSLSPDERTLFVTNGGTNSVAVIQLEDDGKGGQVIGLIPTGWYPNSVSLSQDGKMLYVVNGKSNAGPNPGACRDTTSIAPGAKDPCAANNQYVWQLTKAGFLSMPVPSASVLSQLSRQVAYNNNFPGTQRAHQDEAQMKFLRERIKHVIYVIKENRTYDQVLGDLDRGNGDPSLAVLPEPITPNHHALARRFVTLDNFLDSGNASNDGWNWTTAARTTDFTEKTIAVNYGGRGLSYDWEGTNRNINVGLPTQEERKAANPATPDDPDLLPGAIDVAAPESSEGEAGAGYLWDAALRAGLSVRNYGVFLDLARYSAKPGDPGYIAPSHTPYQDRIVQAYPTKPALQPITDLYFRGYDQSTADFWRFKEWEREFEGFVQDGKMPALQMVRLPHDHFGNFATAQDGVNTVETQMADNDYALGLLVDKVSKSRYKDDTLIFVIEDDAQDGPDHVDAHRSIAYVIGPYVKQDAVVSTRYTTVNMLRTIEDVLGLEPMGLNDGLSKPMTEVFGNAARPWNYTALVPEVLRTTQLPLPAKTADNCLSPARPGLAYDRPRRDAAYWETVMHGQDFREEDHLDTGQFNRALWTGLMGDGKPYPTVRDGRDLSKNREALLGASDGIG